MENNLLKTIDVNNKQLLKIKSEISNNKINLLININKTNVLKKFTNFSKFFGKSLKYNNRDYYKFNEMTNNEVGLHTDGVSCLVKKKIPKLLFFYIKKWPQNYKGLFKIVSTKKLIKKIPDTYLKILKDQDLEYFNYYPNHINKSQNIVSFKKKCMYKINGSWTLNMFLPIKRINPDINWKYKMKFSDLTLKESKKILSKIRTLAEERDCCMKISLPSNSILIFDNEKFFHGREKFTKTIKRSLYRIQILN